MKDQPHYTKGNIQAIDFIRDQKMDFEEGCVIKYVTRYKEKNGLEDLRKAQVYLSWLIDRYDEPLEEIKPQTKSIIQTYELSYNDLAKLTDEMAQSIYSSGAKFDSILAVPKGGLTPAHILAEKLNIKKIHTDINQVPRNEYVLVVDDVCETGKTLAELLINASFRHATAVVAQKMDSFLNCDFVGLVYGAEIDYLFMPWERK
ncbi:MAG: DUF3310 domain-containing protein [Ignisphaera sp.]|nr:DUF3310 domain-containing protein [Ignisphaera sp.]